MKNKKELSENVDYFKNCPIWLPTLITFSAGIILGIFIGLYF